MMNKLVITCSSNDDLALTARGSNLDVRIGRRQILASKVDPRTISVKPSRTLIT